VVVVVVVEEVGGHSYLDRASIGCVYHSYGNEEQPASKSTSILVFDDLNYSFYTAKAQQVRGGDLKKRGKGLGITTNSDNELHQRQDICDGSMAY
jgi:hypothetical protein